MKLAITVLLVALFAVTAFGQSPPTLRIVMVWPLAVKRGPMRCRRGRRRDGGWVEFVAARKQLIYVAGEIVPFAREAVRSDRKEKKDGQNRPQRFPSAS